MRRASLIFALALASASPAPAHDIPNARVDRSIQAVVQPGRLAIDYEVSLSELTLTQDLRNLIGSLPGADRGEWFDRYGREVGPLNAKGLLVSVDGKPLTLAAKGFDLAVEEHPRYSFHLEALIPPRGRLAIQDTNYAGSEGTSRLAIAGQAGALVHGDDLPTDVKLIPIRPVWQLTDAEERRTKQAVVDYRLEAVAATALPPPPSRAVPAVEASTPAADDRLTRLLDRASGRSVLGLALIALALGAAHAVQPGHGKTLVAATVVAEGGSWLRGVLLAAITTLTHTGSVLLVAAGLWFSRSTRYGAVHSALTHGAGFAIAAIGFWRLGRHLGGFGEHDDGHEGAALDPRGRGLIGLGVAGGMVPCWDAVALIVLAEAVGRLALGVALLVAFGLGMAGVLVAVGWAAARFRQALERRRPEGAGVRWLGIGSSLLLVVMGLYLLGRP